MTRPVVRLTALAAGVALALSGTFAGSGGHIARAAALQYEVSISGPYTPPGVHGYGDFFADGPLGGARWAKPMDVDTECEFETFDASGNETSYTYMYVDVPYHSGSISSTSRAGVLSPTSGLADDNSTNVEGGAYGSAHDNSTGSTVTFSGSYWADNANPVTGAHEYDRVLSGGVQLTFTGGTVYGYDYVHHVAIHHPATGSMTCVAGHANTEGEAEYDYGD